MSGQGGRGEGRDILAKERLCRRIGGEWLGRGRGRGVWRGRGEGMEEVSGQGRKGGADIGRLCREIQVDRR